MLTREQHQEIIDRIRATAGEETGALISDDLALLVSDHASGITELEESNTKITDLTKKNAELVEVNGKLFKKVGFEEKIDEKPEEKEMEEIVEEDIFDEKGEFIK